MEERGRNIGESARLTERQRRYVARLASGMSPAQAAAVEFVHVRTIANALTRAKRRIGAPTLSNLVALAVERGDVVHAGDRQFVVPSEVAR